MNHEQLRRAAEAGHADAQLRLGIALMTGEGVPAQDAAQGREWLARAAEAGQSDAQRFLGMILLRGMDVVPDYEAGVGWLERAARAGDAEAGWVLACFRGGARDSWFDGAAALKSLRRAAGAGHPRALTHLAYCLLRGVLGEADLLSGLDCLREAVAAGDPGALLLAAVNFEHGIVFPSDRDRALDFARAAAGQGWPVADEYARDLERAGAQPGAGVSLPTECLEPLTDDLVPNPRLEVLSWQPRLIALHRFLDAFECAEIVSAAREHVMPSFIVDAEGRLGKHAIRTSQEVRLRPGIRNVVVQAVEQRMADCSHVPVEHGEYPLVLRYEHEQSFEQHYDYFIPEKFAMGEGPLELGGQRIATQLVYLNCDFDGGETRFDRAGLCVRPERGLCVMFYNVGPDHNVDPLTRHTGVAVSRCVKWLLSRWIRELPSDKPSAGHPRDRYGLAERS